MHINDRPRSSMIIQSNQYTQIITQKNLDPLTAGSPQSWRSLLALDSPDVLQDFVPLRLPLTFLRERLVVPVPHVKFNHPTLFLPIGIDSRISDIYRRLLCPPPDLRPCWQLRAQAIPQLQLVLSAMTVRCRRLALLQRVHAVGGHLLVALGDNPIASHLDKVVVPGIISLPASLPEPSWGQTQGALFCRSPAQRRLRAPPARCSCCESGGQCA